MVLLLVDRLPGLYVVRSDFRYSSTLLSIALNRTVEILQADSSH